MQMKTIYIRSFMAAVLVLLMSACVSENLEKGEPELEGCMGVYFPEGQKNAKDHTLEKGVDASSLNFILRRVNCEESAEIPYEYTVYKLVQNTQPGDTVYTEVPNYDDSGFQFGSLVFNKHQKEASITVEFDNLPVGERYRCSISITDPKYAQIYGYAATSVSFTVQTFEWTKLKGKAIYREGFFSDIINIKETYLETEVDIYERRDKKGFYRLDNLYSAAFLARMNEGEESYNENKAALEKQYSAYTISGSKLFVDASDPKKVYIPNQNIGVSPSFLGGDIYIASDVPEVFGAQSNLLYGTLSEDGVISFPANAITLGMGGNYYFSNAAGKFRIVLPDGKTEDYGLDLSMEDAADDSSRPIIFKPAKDVSSIKYKVFPGKFTELGLEAKINDTDKSGAEFIVAEGEKEIRKNITPGENASTNIYTLVACTYDADGKRQEHATIEFGYVKPGEKKNVKIYIGLYTDDQYAPHGYSSENSFRYWVRGEDITSAQLSYYPTAYYETYKEDIHKDLKRYGSVNAQTLKALNSDDGLSGMLGNTFKAGTNYTFVVYAENGYQGEFITDTINTRGIQDKMKQSYYKIDIENYEQPSADAYTGSWIPVSVDVFGDGKAGRMIRGNWRCREVELSVSGDEVSVEGLFPSLETNPVTKFDLKDGLLVSKENRSSRVWVKDSTNVIPSMRFEYLYYPKTGAFSEQGYFYNTYDTEDKKEREDMFVGGFVHEDIIAFVDNSTTLRFWAMAMGGYQKNSMGDEELQNIIGESHGELILVRKGSEMLKGLKYADQSVKEGENLLNPISEAGRFEHPKFGILDVERKEVDNTTGKLVEFKQGVRTKTIMK